MQTPTNARTLPTFPPSFCAAPVNAGAPPPVLVFVADPTGVGDVRSAVAVDVVKDPTVDIAVTVVVLVDEDEDEDPELVDEAVRAPLRLERKLDTAAFVLLNPLLTELATLLTDELALRTGPPGVTEGETVVVDTVVRVETEEELEDDADVSNVVVVVDMPDKITEVVVDVTVGSGKVGSTRVEVNEPAVTTTVVESAVTKLNSAARARRFLKAGIVFGRQLTW